MEKHVISKTFQSRQGLPFENLVDLTDASILNATPDFYDQVPSCRPKPLSPGRIDRFHCSVDQQPNLSPRAKARQNSLVKRHACYDGALGNRGMQALWSYADPEASLDVMYTGRLL